MPQLWGMVKPESVGGLMEIMAGYERGTYTRTLIGPGSGAHDYESTLLERVDYAEQLREQTAKVRKG